MSETSVNEQQGGEVQMPTDTTIRHAIQLAITSDRPIQMDYWLDSCVGNVIIGVRELEDGTNEKLLVKSSDEYTSPVVKIYQVETEFIILTVNSTYIVRADIQKKKIS